MSTPELTIMRKLDVSKLGPEAIVELAKFNEVDLVDNDRARDYWLTDELIAATTGFAIADPNGEILADNFGSIIDAEQAAEGATISYSIEIPGRSTADPMNPLAVSMLDAVAASRARVAVE